ncbi:MAG: hypothetical protein ACTSYD_05545 [Candidatus Heimdallarchaeaceae archaeon]
MLQSLPASFPSQKSDDEKLLMISDLETKLHQFTEKAETTVPTPPKQPLVQIPEIELKDIPPIEIQELKIRYVMQLAIRAATRIFQEEIQAEQEYLQGKYTEREYLEKRNEIESKQNRIFHQFYKLSDMLFLVTRNHLYKSVHDNFLLFNNELSENINRIRERSISPSELKGIIYEINQRVSKHLPILKKAKEDTLKWKINVQQEKEKFKQFLKKYEKKLTEEQKTKVNRIIQELEIYEKLLDEDINDYATDIIALNEIYGDHLYYQEFGTPLFNDLPLKVEKRIKRFAEVMGISELQNQRLEVLNSQQTYNLDQELMRQLRSMWLVTGRPVIDEQGDLVGFVVGPGKLGEQFGVIIKQQQEISLSMARRIYDHIVAPMVISPLTKTEEEKRDFLVKEIIRTLPMVPFTFLVPDNIIHYCSHIGTELSEEIQSVLVQPENYLFVPIEHAEKENRMIKIDSSVIANKGYMLPYFDPRKKNEIENLLDRTTEIIVRDLYKQKIGKAHSVIFHPNKGYFLVIRLDSLPERFYAKVFDILYSDSETKTLNTGENIEKKKWELIFRLSREYDTSEGEIEDVEKIKEILVEKNTGILPQTVENANYKLVSLGNIKIFNNELSLSYGAPLFSVEEVFNIKGKIIENIKGEELGIVYTFKINTNPCLYVWSEINFELIALLVNEDITKIVQEHRSFVTDLETSIAFKMNIAPQLALRPDIVITFMNLIGRINSLKEMEEIFQKFKPIELELNRIISIEDKKILVDIADISEILPERAETSREEQQSQFYVEAPDYYLKRNQSQ